MAKQNLRNRDLPRRVQAGVQDRRGVAVCLPAFLENQLLERDPQMPVLEQSQVVVRECQQTEMPTLDVSIMVAFDGSFIDKDDFLVADIQMESQRHFVFATEYQLSLLRDAKRWYINGTFKVVGEPFRRNGQLFSIHAFIEKAGQLKQMPLAFCLMSRRTKVDYISVLEAIKERIGTASVEGFVADFEQAAWQAVRDVFPGVEVKGCAFHWSQAVWRHVQSVGLAEAYRRRIGVHNFVRMLLALQCLPAAHIAGAVDALRAKATSAATEQLVDYVTRQWLNNSVFFAAGLVCQTIRTNNDVEGWHHRINSKAECAA